jgi:NAD(P)H-quinone oxidoreductase subunit 5
MPAFYAAWHAIAGGIVPAAATLLPVAVLPMLALPAVATLSLLVVTNPTHALAQWLYPHASAGFHLDDLFTRLTFIVWPPRRLVQRPVVRGAALALVIRRAA